MVRVDEDVGEKRKGDVIRSESRESDLLPIFCSKVLLVGILERRRGCAR